MPQPENILLHETEYGPEIKLADFGLSLMVDEFSMIRSKAGTPLYMGTLDACRLIFHASALRAHMRGKPTMSQHRR